MTGEYKKASALSSMNTSRVLVGSGYTLTIPRVIDISILGACIKRKSVLVKLKINLDGTKFVIFVRKENFCEL